MESGTPAERIVLGGFSQGGAVSLAAAITTKHKLAGLSILSSYVPIREKLKEARHIASFTVKSADIFSTA